MFSNGILVMLPYKAPDDGRILGSGEPGPYYMLNAELKYVEAPPQSLSRPPFNPPPPRFWITEDVDQDRLVPMQPQPHDSWLPSLVASRRSLGLPGSGPLGLGPVQDPAPPSSNATGSGPGGVQDVQSQTVQPVQSKMAKGKRAQADKQPSRSSSGQSTEASANSRTVSGHKKPGPEKLVDYGLTDNFDSTSAEVPERMVHGGVFRPRPGFSEDTSEECLDKGKGKEKETDESEETIMENATEKSIPIYPDQPVILPGVIKPPTIGNQPGNQVPAGSDRQLRSKSRGKGKERETDEAKETIVGDGIEKLQVNEKAKENDIDGVGLTSMPMRSDAPRSFGGSGEELTEEEKAFSVEAQKTIDADEMRIKISMQLSEDSMKDLPTAEEAEKSRKGLSKEEFANKMGIELDKLEENESKLDAAEAARSSISEEALRIFGIDVDAHNLVHQPQLPQQNGYVMALQNGMVQQLKARRGFFCRLGNYPEVMMEIATYLRPKDLVNLYSVSKDFHDIIESFLSHTMLSAAKKQAPESASVFLFKFYGDLCIPDPAGRLHPIRDTETRLVPGLRWLRMVVHRERTIRDILALMARQGHRMPEGMSLSLKKMWLIMDVSINRQRVQLLRSPFFTDMDIFNMQLFVVKLDMRFNDPNDGPGEDKLRKLMLGQRGLTPLCKLLKREIGLTPIEIIQMGIRYAYSVRPEYRGLPLLGIPPEQIGVGHLEGWGNGKIHLLRPDELTMRESIRRRLGLKDHIMGMLLWGYVDPVTGENLEPTDEEKYMSDEEGEEEYVTWEEVSDSDSDQVEDEMEEAMEDLNIDPILRNLKG
jgi:hypothetical protein